jgi:hypothetical protein
MNHLILLVDLKGLTIESTTILIKGSREWHWRVLDYLKVKKTPSNIIDGVFSLSIFGKNKCRVIG